MFKNVNVFLGPNKNSLFVDFSPINSPLHQKSFNLLKDALIDHKTFFQRREEIAEIA